MFHLILSFYCLFDRHFVDRFPFPRRHGTKYHFSMPINSRLVYSVTQVRRLTLATTSLSPEISTLQHFTISPLFLFSTQLQRVFPVLHSSSDRAVLHTIVQAPYLWVYSLHWPCCARWSHGSLACLCSASLGIAWEAMALTRIGEMRTGLRLAR